MKHSIKRQIGFTFIGLILLSLLAIEVCNLFFLEEFHRAKKIEILLQGMNTLNSVEDFNRIDEEQSNELYDFCVANNLSYVVTNRANTVIYYNTSKAESDRLASRIFGYWTGFEESVPEVLRETEQYRIQENQVKNKVFIEIWGELDDGRNFMIQTPLESIQDSVAVSNHFYLYIGVVLL